MRTRPWGFLMLLALSGCKACGDDVFECDPLEWFTDADGDGFGSGEALIGCVAYTGTVSEDGDCDDTNAEEHPGAIWYPDGDGDGHGDAVGLVVACEQPEGYVSVDDDCDDADDTRFPGNVEACDAVDNDCDGDVPATETDDDGDEQAECAGDCDDLRPDVYDGAPEWCDGVQNDCGGTGDEAGIATHFPLGGDPIDLSSAFAVGTADDATLVSVEGGGDLNLCDGMYYATVKTSSVNVRGFGAVIVDAVGEQAALEVTEGTVTIANLRLTHGTAGLIVQTAATATADDLLINENQRGVLVVGALDLADAIVSDNTIAEEGAGIQVFPGGSLVATRVTVTGNAATSGGGIAAFGTADLVDCDVTENSASVSGAGIYVFGAELEMTGGSIASNIATELGGGIFASSASTVALTDTLEPSATRGRHLRGLGCRSDDGNHHERRGTCQCRHQRRRRGTRRA